MTSLKNSGTTISGGALDQLLGQFIQPLMPQLGSDIFNDCNYTGPGTIGTGVLGIDALRSTPFLVTRTGVINRIGFNVTTGGGGGSIARCGVYASDPSSYMPTVMLADSGSFDTTTTGFKSAAVSIAVTAGQILWLVYTAGVAAATISSVASGMHLGILGASSSALYYNSLTVGLAHGALPATWPGGSAPNTSSGPAILIRYA